MIVLREYQRKCIDRVMSYIKRNPKQHPIIALPTGAGKSYVISGVINSLIAESPDINILVVSHVQEILLQDCESIIKHSDISPGIYSSGLNRKEIKQVTVAGIQSIHRHPEYFEKFTFIIIDECHLIPNNSDSMYRKFLDAMPQAVCFGVTATPFRLGDGYIYGQNDSIFDNLIYDLTSREQFNKLIADGYLCNLKTQGTSIELEADDIKLVGGDFDKKILSETFNIDNITKKAVAELIDKGIDRKKWLVFAIDIDHAENITMELCRNGITAMVIHSKVDFDRSAILRGFADGTFQCIVNVNVLTTGFDDPEIDLIALMRPTKSPVIHIQTIGRGLRISPGKKDCLILDFAGNTERLGAINDITPPDKKRKLDDVDGDPITKRCPMCDTIHPPALKVCTNCGHKFKFQSLLKSTTSNADVINDGVIKWKSVDKVSYKLYNKINSPSMMLVKYECGLNSYSEYICIEHKGYSKYRAKYWLEHRGMENVSTAIQAVHESKKLKKPKQIRVDLNGKYPVISDYKF